MPAVEGGRAGTGAGVGGAITDKIFPSRRSIDLALSSFDSEPSPSFFSFTSFHHSHFLHTHYVEIKDYEAAFHSSFAAVTMHVRS